MFRFLRTTMLWIVLLPYLVTGVGAASNQLVLIANHDKFPVMLNEAAQANFQPDPNGLIDKEHCVMTSETHLNALADIFDLHDGWYSIGDFILMIGEWLQGFCLYVWLALAGKHLWETQCE